MANIKEQKHNGDSCIMSGYLKKESVHLKRFRQRWMVLKKNGCLYSYKKKGDIQPTEIIDLALRLKVDQ